ncbi:MAG: rhomboid family intramembrane serine protease [Cytophagaceae bacterium]|jgi:membrane associated rhomboid family serine protease|nr:rhomboid family intramembrane serine protease [Cytophagaceae bacterium]
MIDYGVSGFVLVLVCILASYKGFRDPSYFNRYVLEIDSLKYAKQYDRILSSGFLHVNVWHLIFNMLSLLSFSSILEHELGILPFVSIYFFSLLGGSLLVLAMHWKNDDYSATGASGAISGLMLAAICMYPTATFTLLFTPYGIPGWLFGIIYCSVSMLGMRYKQGSICHEGHLGGAIAGLICIAIIRPETILLNGRYISGMLAVIIILTIYLYKPFRNGKYFVSNSRKKGQNIGPIANEERLNFLLEKIHQHGYQSLSKSEKEFLSSISSTQDKGKDSL